MIENDWNVKKMIHNIIYIYIIYNSGTLHLRGVIENWNPWLWSAVSGSHWISGAASLWPGKKTDWKKDEKGWFARKWVSQANKQTNSAIPYKYYIYMVQTLVAATESNTIDSSILRPLSTHSAQFVPRNPEAIRFKSVFLASWDHVNHVIR